MKEKIIEILMKILFFVILFGFSTITLFLSFKEFDWTEEKLLSIFLKSGIEIIFSLFFILFGIYGIIVSLKKQKNAVKLTDEKENYWHSTYMPDGTYFPYNLLIIFYLLAITFLTGVVVILINILVNSLSGQVLINNIISLIICSLIFAFTIFCIINDYKQKLKHKDNY